HPPTATRSDTPGRRAGGRHGGSLRWGSRSARARAPTPRLSYCYDIVLFDIGQSRRFAYVERRARREKPVSACFASPAFPPGPRDVLLREASGARPFVVAGRRVIEVGDAQPGLVDQLRDARHLVELDLRHLVGVGVVVRVQ